MDTLITTLNSWTGTASDYAVKWKDSAAEYSKLCTDFGRLSKEIILLSFEPSTYSDPTKVELLRSKVVLYHEMRQQLFGQ